MEVAQKHQGGRNRPRRWLLALAAPVLLLAITAGFFWKLVLTDQYTWLEGSDIANQVLPWFQFQAGEWHRGRLPLWDPYQGTGQSLIGQGQPGTAYPPNWILFSLPLRNGWIRQTYLHWYFVLIHFLAALFCYWLCRDLKRSRAASMLAAAAFSLGGYVGATDWPQMLNGAIWMPLVFLFMLRALRRRNSAGNAALAGMFLGVSWLSGHHQIPIFVTLVVTAIWGYHAARGARLNWRVLRSAALFYVFAVLSSGLQTLPAFEYGRLAKRWVSLEHPVGWSDPVPYVVHTEFSLEPTFLLGLVVPGIYRHGDPLIGVVVLALAVAGIGLALRNPAARLFALTGVAGLLLALGGYSVLHGALYAVVPMVEKARVPVAATVILHFGIAVLSAWGIDRLSSLRDVRPLRRLSLGLALAGSALYLMLAALWIFKDRQKYDGLAFAALTCLLFAAVLWARSRRCISGRAMTLGCLLLVLMELGSARADSFPHRLEADRNKNLKKIAQTAEIAAFLKRQAWPFRIDIDEQTSSFNFGDWHGIDVLYTSSPSLPANYVAMEPASERTQMLLGVTYELRAKPREPGQQLLFAGPGGMNIYHNLAAFPRVWTVHEVVRLNDARQVGPCLGDRKFDLARKAFVVGEAPPALEAASGADSVRLVRREPELVRIEAEMRSQGMVVLSDAFYPGWQATLDGRPVSIHEVYGGLRGVVTPAGRHVIEMRYRPLSVTLGAIMTALGVFGACVLALFGPPRRMLRYREAITQRP